MSISTGLVGVNLYYNQPLLHKTSIELDTSQASISKVALATQLGYAAGLFFIIPLGYKIPNKQIFKFDLALMILSLIAASVSSTLILLIISSFFIGFSSALPQLLVLGVSPYPYVLPWCILHLEKKCCSKLLYD